MQLTCKKTAPLKNENELKKLVKKSKFILSESYKYLSESYKYLSDYYNYNYEVIKGGHEGQFSVIVIIKSLIWFNKKWSISPVNFFPLQCRHRRHRHYRCCYKCSGWLGYWGQVHAPRGQVELVQGHHVIQVLRLKVDNNVLHNYQLVHP